MHLDPLSGQPGEIIPQGSVQDEARILFYAARHHSVQPTVAIQVVEQGLVRTFCVLQIQSAHVQLFTRPIRRELVQGE